MAGKNEWDKMADKQESTVKKMLEEKVEEKVAASPGTDAEGMRLMLRAAVEEMMPALMAAFKAGTPQPAPHLTAATPAAIARAQSDRALAAPDCPECRQKLHACNGEHVRMLVTTTLYPQFRNIWKGFTVNGVTYLSTGDQDMCVVPTVLVGLIQYSIQKFEKRENEARLGADYSAWTRNSAKAKTAQALGLI